MFLLSIAIACAVGGVIRYLGANAVTRITGDKFPWGILVVNASGSFILGCVIGADSLWVSDESSIAGLKGMMTIGFCGGMTTFSTFSLQTMELTSKKNYYRVLGYISASLILSLLGVLSGFSVGELII